MRTYYFGAVITSSRGIARSFYAVEATHYDSAERAVIMETEWLWSNGWCSFQLFEMSRFLFDNRQSFLSVVGKLLCRGVPA